MMAGRFIPLEMTRERGAAPAPAGAAARATAMKLQQNSLLALYSVLEFAGDPRGTSRPAEIARST
jgi:hypothetical protein